MRYERSVPFSGDRGKAVETAKSVLMASAFEVELARETELSAVGPGMSSTLPFAAVTGTQTTRSLRGQFMARKRRFVSCTDRS